MSIIDHKDMLKTKISSSDISPADKELCLRIRQMQKSMPVFNDNTDSRSALDTAISGAKKFQKLDLRRK